MGICKRRSTLLDGFSIYAPAALHSGHGLIRTGKYQVPAKTEILNECPFNKNLWLHHRKILMQRTRSAVTVDRRGRCEIHGTMARNHKFLHSFIFYFYLHMGQK